MPTFSLSRITKTGSIGLALLGSGLVGHSAIAQNAEVASAPQKQGDIRAGVLFPLNSRLSNNVGKTIPLGGVDIVVKHEGASQNTVFGAEYEERSEHGFKIQVIPITIGQVTYSGQSSAGFRPYAGYGVGAYLIQSTLPDSNGFTVSNNSTAFGGYLDFGLDLTNEIFVDARYNAVTKVGPASASGFEISGGFRF
jgi:hypothetical protein